MVIIIIKIKITITITIIIIITSKIIRRKRIRIRRRGMKIRKERSVGGGEGAGQERRVGGGPSAPQSLPGAPRPLSCRRHTLAVLPSAIADGSSLAREHQSSHLCPSVRSEFVEEHQRRNLEERYLKKSFVASKLLKFCKRLAKDTKKIEKL